MSQQQREAEKTEPAAAPLESTHPESDEGGGPADRDLPGVVDDLERRITDERREANVPGNADHRADTRQVESDDQAPE